MTQSSGSRMFSSIVLTVFASILIVQLSDAFHVSHTRTSMKVSRSAVVKMSDNKAESSSGDDENSFMDILSGMYMKKCY